MKKLLVVLFLLSTFGIADQTIIAKKVPTNPKIDGDISDKVWEQTDWIKTYDKIAKIDIFFKVIYTNTHLSFLVKYPDETKNIEHKTFVWDNKKKKYITSGKREDVFVIKWNMEDKKADISLSANEPYSADIWFWKANRTNPKGYADDKIQYYNSIKSKKSKALFSKNGDVFFLTRKGDRGQSSYKLNIYFKYIKDTMDSFSYRTPTGSRADIKAKGIYKDGYWNIEFLRKLDTKNSADDLIFDTSKKYYFGVSRFEISGMLPNKAFDQPYYNSGEINEIFELKFSK